MIRRLIRDGTRVPAVLLLLAVSQANSDDGSAATGILSSEQWARQALRRYESPPLGLPAVPTPKQNPVTIPKLILGRKLFFDRRLSVNGTMSCAMCHIPEQGFTNNELSIPIGVGGRSLRRNAPTVLNSAFAKPIFLDGRESSLESQATLPLLAPDEMANPSAESLIEKIHGLPEYAGLFEKAFGGAPTLNSIGRAIASWERTLLAANSPFDRWYYGGEVNALTDEQQRGFALFVGKGRCVECHIVGGEYSLLTDQQFHDTGIGYRRDVANRQETAPVKVQVAPQVFSSIRPALLAQVGRPRPVDEGRFEVTRQSADRWRFKTPSLRNVAVTAPYMHDGSLGTLEAVVRFYDEGGVAHPGRDPRIKPLGLSDNEIGSLVMFLRGLTASNLDELVSEARR